MHLCAYVCMPARTYSHPQSPPHTSTPTHKHPHTHSNSVWQQEWLSTLLVVSTGLPMLSGLYRLITLGLTMALTNTVDRRVDHDGAGDDGDTTMTDMLPETTTAPGPSSGINTQPVAAAKTMPNDTLQHHLVPSLQNTLRAYLTTVAIASGRFDGELLASTLHLLLAAPPTLLPRHLMIPSLCAALRTGLQQPPLAAAAVDVLEAWEAVGWGEVAGRVACEVAPLLEPYLGELVTREVAPDAAGEGGGGGGAGGGGGVEEEREGESAEEGGTQVGSTSGGGGGMFWVGLVDVGCCCCCCVCEVSQPLCISI